MGVQRIRDAGLEPVVHPNTLKGHLFFAGTDEERAQAVWEMALDPTLPVLWAARGGYGSARILPLLDRLAKKHRKALAQETFHRMSRIRRRCSSTRARTGAGATCTRRCRGLRQFCALAGRRMEARCWR